MPPVGGGVVVAHYSTYVGATRNGGKGVAIDHSCCTFEQAHQSTGVGCSLHRASQNATVVDAGGSYSVGGYGTCITRDIDRCGSNDDILNHGIFHISKQGLAPSAGDGYQLAIDGALKGTIGAGTI